MTSDEPQLHRAVSTGDMKADWDRRARTDYRSAIMSAAPGEEAFRATGREDAARILRLLGGADVSTWRAIDYGCGVGRVIEPMAAHVGEVVGLDISDEMVRVGGERLAGLPNVRLLVLGSGPFPLESASVDLAWSVHVFQHMPRQAFHRAMDEIGRVLKPGGMFVFHLTYPYTLKRKVQALLRKDQTPDETYRRRFYTPGELRSVFARCGLVLVHFERAGDRRQQAWYVTRKRPATG